MNLADSVVGARDGWLKITGASNARNGRHARPTFGGTGRVDGAVVLTGIQSGRGRAEPDRRRARWTDFRGDWLTDHGSIAGCSGPWVLVDYCLYTARRELVRLPARPYRAWFRSSCAGSKTKCDVPSVGRNAAGAPGTGE